MKGRRVERLRCFCVAAEKKADPRCPGCSGTGHTGLVFVDPPSGEQRPAREKPTAGRGLELPDLLRLRARVAGRGGVVRFAREAGVPFVDVERLARGGGATEEVYEAVLAVLNAEALE